MAYVTPAKAPPAVRWIAVNAATGSATRVKRSTVAESIVPRFAEMASVRRVKAYSAVLKIVTIVATGSAAQLRQPLVALIARVSRCAGTVPVRRESNPRPATLTAAIATTVFAAIMKQFRTAPSTAGIAET